MALLEFRPLLPEDQDQLWNWLHISLWDPPPAGLRPRDVLRNPHVRIYAEDWGRPDDIGVVAVLDGEDIGACWMRLLPDGQGLAFVDQTTLQLGIAILPQHQRRGYGRKLMMAALRTADSAGARQIALTVHPENSAIRLYEDCGFEKHGLRSSYHLMVRSASGANSG